MKYIYLVLAFLCNAYFVALQVSSPLSFGATVFGYSIVWFLLSIFFILLFLMSKFDLWKKVSENVKNALFGGFTLLFIVSLLNLLFIVHPKLLKNDSEVKYVIVLGGGITKNSELPDTVKERLGLAADYLKKNPDALAVVTGGQGRFAPCPEAVVMKPYLESLGIEGKRILCEDQAKDTIQNLQKSARLISEHENIPVSEVLSSPVAIVTSFFHIARSERLAKRIGYTEVYGISSKTPFLFILNSYTREILCYIKLNLRIILTGKPNLLTE